MNIYFFDMLLNLANNWWYDEEYEKHIEVSHWLLGMKRKRIGEKSDFHFQIRKIDADTTKPRSITQVRGMTAVVLDIAKKRHKQENKRDAMATLQATTKHISNTASEVLSGLLSSNTRINISSPELVLEQPVDDISFDTKLAQIKNKAKQHKILEIFYETIRFAVIFVASFAMITIFLNISSYIKIFSDIGGSADSVALAAVVSDTSLASNISNNNKSGEFALFGETPENNPVIDIALQPTIPGFHIVIPSLGINAPVIEPEKFEVSNGDLGFFEAALQKALKKGVVHYPSTSLPGESGNVVLTGHSSYYFWDDGKYKDIFATLHKIKIGDDIYVFRKGKKYVYRVESKTTVKPEQVEVLDQTADNRLTLITCTPVGTALNRLIIVAKEIKQI